MIGVFDSGHGGLTILRQLQARMPEEAFLYLGDHANAPYGDRPAQEVLALTTQNIETLFEQGCRLVILACNTASCVALRSLQQGWLPESQWEGRNVLGIAVPTVEAATGMDWAETHAQAKTGLVGVFGTLRTVTSDVYPIEIGKRCPAMRVIQQAVPELVTAIEAGSGGDVLDKIVRRAVEKLLAQAGNEVPGHIILGCTHFDLVRGLFERHLPPSSRIIDQPEAVADSLAGYLERHPEYKGQGGETGLFTTGDPAHVNASARLFWPECGEFESLSAGRSLPASASLRR